MKFLRTPSERFNDLEGYAFKENYIGLGHKNDDGQEMRMHYLDEGEGTNGKVMVLLHGEPSWSYLYRKMIPVFVENGFRVIAPDLIGFGKSDKPINQEDYTYQNHLDWVEPIFADLGLKNITLFLQDWGGLLGLRLLEKYDSIIDNVVLSNTFLPEGLRDPGAAFINWQKFALNASEFPVGNVINMGTASNLSKEVLAGYEAPFPDESYKAGARIFPAIVPIEKDNPEAIKNIATWQFLEKYEKPVLTLFGDSDPIMKNAEKVFMKRVPGTKGQPHEIIKQGGHFIQEDKGEELAEKIVQFLKDK